MMSFTNNLGDSVSVDEEHLQIALKIKLELQKVSPSRKVSWSVHKSCMEKEGFYNSDSNENYRSMIKRYQKDIGELPSVASHANMIADNKLESIKEMVGEIAYEKRDNQNVLRELNKVKRNVIDFTLITEEISKVFKDYDWSSLKLNKSIVSKVQTDTHMIVGLSDLHIGAIVNIDINTYNFQVAIRRLNDFMNQVIIDARHNNVSEIHVVGMGDTVEHAQMRFAQSYNVEFPFSKQLVKASDLIIKFLSGLVNEGFNVSYAGFGGNHDRVDGDKNKGIDGDHALIPINHAINIFIENSGFENITYVQAKDYSHNLNINGRNIKLIHGDLDSMKDEKLLDKLSSHDGINYDVVVGGHLHHFRDVEVGYDKRIVIFGSLKGSDDYGERIRKISVASQGYILIKSDGEIEVKQVKLK